MIAAWTPTCTRNIRATKTVYKVQVGAYRSRAAADDAAADFRQKGVPVTVSPVTP